MAPTKRKKKYTDDDLMKAVALVKSRSLSVNQASNRYNIPTSTIKDRLSGRYPAATLNPGKKDQLIEHRTKY